ncbi:unnamed protein product [Leptosia nina]|uniref:Uncharacterized protein n=1 Tax=Leptosia nina TaxID=320188 RepID=A0AAV1IZP7_9NEOP
MFWLIYTTFLSPTVASVGPHMHRNQSTTCEEFGKFARFNPYSVLHDEWMSFYHWGPDTAPMYVKFAIPTTKQIDYLKQFIDGYVLEPVNWTATLLILKERNNITQLLVEQNDRGSYILYMPYRNLKPGQTVDSMEIQLKQVERGKYIGLMNCQYREAYALTRWKDMPNKKHLQNAAAKIGYRGRNGKSYLYRGHQWMPIGESDHDYYWHLDHHLDDTPAHHYEY